MIHSARPTVLLVENIVFALNCFILKSGDGRTDGRTTCAKIMITTGRDCGLAEWINSPNYELKVPASKIVSQYTNLVTKT